MNEDYLTAKAIILKSFKSGKLLTEYKLWDQLDYDARSQALKDSFKKCDMCLKTFHVSKLQLVESNTYGDFFECSSCMRKRNYI